MLTRQNFRQIWLQAHLWPGLFLGAVFALLGLTGSILCFYQEIDLRLNPVQQVGTTPAGFSVQSALNTLRATYPTYRGAWRLEMPPAAGRPVLARYYHPPETAGRSFAPFMATLDPQTLRVTSGRFWGEYPVTWLYDLHYTLLLDKPGRLGLGIAGTVTLLSLLSGIYLWRPAQGKLPAALRPRIRSGRIRALYDWHTLGGIYGLPVLVMLVVTGVVLEVPEYVRPLVDRLSPLAPPVSVHSGDAAGRPMLTADAAIHAARAVMPQATLRWVETPADAAGVYRVNFWQPGEPSYRFPRTNVWVDAYSGDILAVRDPRRFSAGDTFFAWQHPLHNGEAFGFAGRVVVFLSGLLPALLWITGVLFWRQKRRGRAKV